jgi:hypothetical protein
MSLLGFEVTPTYLTFLALFYFLIYVLMSFPKSLLSISLKELMFSKASLSFMLLIFVHCMCLFVSLEELWKPRNILRIMYSSNFRLCA